MDWASCRGYSHSCAESQPKALRFLQHGGSCTGPSWLPSDLLDCIVCIHHCSNRAFHEEFHCSQSTKSFSFSPKQPQHFIPSMPRSSLGVNLKRQWHDLPSLHAVGSFPDFLRDTHEILIEAWAILDLGEDWMDFQAEIEAWVLLCSF